MPPIILRGSTYLEQAKNLGENVYYVYNWWRGNVSLYVGCTRNILRRLKSHGKITKDRIKPDDIITVTAQPDATTARNQERFLIALLKPTYNLDPNKTGPKGTATYDVGQALYPVFISLAEHALENQDLKLFWLYSDLCDTIHVHLLERHRIPKPKPATAA